MRLFQPTVEFTLKALGAILLGILVVLPAAWGYEQRQKARTWQNIACAYRIREVERYAPMFNGMSRRPDACTTLHRLGLEVEMPW